MKQIPCRISDELHEKLRKIAFEERTSIAELIRKALNEKYLKKYEAAIISEPALMRIWNNPEDSLYDKL